MNTEKKDPQPFGRYRPSLCFYHANQKGSGSAVKMDLHPAQDGKDGCIMLTIANQRTVGDRHAPTPTFSTFDWESSIHVKLDFSDITQMLQVFRGERESINDGKGLYHRSAKGATSIRLAHLIEPIPGYMLDICRKLEGESDDAIRARMLFSPAEALGLHDAIAGSMYLICFGIPIFTNAAPKADAVLV